MRLKNNAEYARSVPLVCAHSAGRVRSRLGGSAADALEGGEVLVVGIGQWVEVLLGGGDLSVTHTVHDGPEVGTAGEQPGGVRVPEVVDAYVEVDPGCFDGGSPDAGAEGVAGDRCAVAGREEQVTGLEAPLLDVGADGLPLLTWRHRHKRRGDGQVSEVR